MRDVHRASFAVKMLQIRSYSASGPFDSRNSLAGCLSQKPLHQGDLQMAMFDQSSNSLRRAIYLALTGAGLALTTQTAMADEGESQELDEVVVTGFRGSLNSALAAKRAETKAIDSIMAEDIGKFPDSNLAESM